MWELRASGGIGEWEACGRVGLTQSQGSSPHGAEEVPAGDGAQGSLPVVPVRESPRVDSGPQPALSSVTSNSRSRPRRSHLETHAGWCTGCPRVLGDGLGWGPRGRAAAPPPLLSSGASPGGVGGNQHLTRTRLASSPHAGQPLAWGRGAVLGGTRARRWPARTAGTWPLVAVHQVGTRRDGGFQRDAESLRGRDAVRQDKEGSVCLCALGMVVLSCSGRGGRPAAP